MKRTIVYCTNEDKLADIDIDAEGKIRGDKIAEGIPNNSIWEKECSIGKIVLLFDQMETNEENKKKISNALNKTEHYAVHHTNMNAELVGLLKETAVSVHKDIHSLSETNVVQSKYYIKLKDIIENDSLTDEQFEELWKDFDELNKLDDALNELCDIWSTIDFTDETAMEKLDANRIVKLNSLV